MDSYPADVSDADPYFTDESELDEREPPYNNYQGPERCWRHGRVDCELCFISDRYKDADQ